ncbi:MAG: hypothetical protein FWG65_02665 [Turicibacter sp.]|nr:hypothetical protein [Turicibacter sp.]
MTRPKNNTGVFAHLPIPMRMRYVKRIAEKYGIDLKDVKVVIDRDPYNLNMGYTRLANPDKIGEIILEPNAFISEEELARTLFHEKIHIEQYKKHGSIYVQNNHTHFEFEATVAESERFGER